VYDHSRPEHSLLFHPTVEHQSVLADIDTTNASYSIEMIVCIGSGTITVGSYNPEQRFCELILSPAAGIKSATASASFDHVPLRTENILYIPIIMRHKNEETPGEKNAKGQWTVQALIVEPTGKLKGEYRRLGLLYHHKSHEDILQGLKESSVAKGENMELGESCGMNEFGYRRWRVRLV
jgi:hypothetical protein